MPHFKAEKFYLTIMNGARMARLLMFGGLTQVGECFSSDVCCQGFTGRRGGRLRRAEDGLVAFLLSKGIKQQYCPIRSTTNSVSSDVRYRGFTGRRGGRLRRTEDGLAAFPRSKGIKQQSCLIRSTNSTSSDIRCQGFTGRRGGRLRRAKDGLAAIPR